MRNSEMFQKFVDQANDIVGIDGVNDPSVPLWHILAAAHDWCGVNGVDFDVVLQEVREQIETESGEG